MPELTVLYDGACGLCRASVARVRRIDRGGRIELLDLYEPSVAARFPQVNREEAMRLMQAVDPRFEFTDPPFRSSLPLTLAFAATADRPTVVLTGPATAVGVPATPIQPSRPADTSGMVRVSLHDHALTASAALVWSTGLPRPLQQILFETADSLTAPPPPRPSGLVSISTA